MDNNFLPFALPDIGEEEIAEVADSLRSGWLTTGPKTKRFEDEFAAYLGVEHAVAVNSGTAGLHLALEALGVGPGDQVITTTYTFTATAEVVRYLGADPILVDIDPDTLNLDPEQVERALDQNPRVKALLPVHVAGQACDMDPLMSLADKHGAAVVEDAAHALPSTYRGRKVGNLGRATMFSFYATKTLTTGEGGMVTTNDPDLARRMKVMRLHGISADVWDRYTSDKPKWFYEVIAPGFKYNMPDLMAAIGLHQLKKADRFLARRTAMAEKYHQALEGLPLRRPRPARPDDVHAWHLYVILLELEKLDIDRDAFIQELSARGIGTGVHFIPLHRHPYWRDRYKLSPRDFPQAEYCYHRAVSLPIYTRMTDADLDRAAEAVRAVLEIHGR